MYGKKVVAFGLALAMTLGLAACGGKGASTSDATSSKSTSTSSSAPASTVSSDKSSKADTKELSGTLNIAGASAMVPLVKEGAKQFMDTNKKVTILVNAGGSGQGLSQISDGSIDIGDSDIFAEEKLDATKAAELVDHRVCVTTMMAAVNAKNPVKSLTKQQMVDIFTGKITNWKDVGGEDKKIMLITRPESSGTRALFTAWALGGQAESKGALETDDNGTLRQALQENDNAIGYLALSYVKDSKGVKGVALDGVEPTLENTYNGTYPVWGFEHMYTKGEPQPLAKAFLDYMTSDEFGKSVEDLGYGVTSKVDQKALDAHMPKAK